METYKQIKSKTLKSQKTGKRVLAVVLLFILFHIMNSISEPNFSKLLEDIMVSIMIIIGIIGLWIGINALPHSRIRQNTIFVYPIHCYTFILAVSAVLFVYYFGVKVIITPGVIIGIVIGAILLLDIRPIHASK